MMSPVRKNTDPGIYPYETAGGRRWGVVFYIDRDWSTGRPRQKRKQGFLTKAEAQAWRAEQIASRNKSGRVVEPSRQLLGAYLDDWLAGMIDLAPGTRRNYRAGCKTIRPYLAGIALANLTPIDIEQCYARMVRGGMTPTKIYIAHRTLKQALRRAVMLDLIPRNPCDRVRGPREPTPEHVIWSHEHMRRFVQTMAQDATWGPLWLLIAETWLRINEALDLRWKDIDFEAGLLTISHALSRDESYRLISGKTKTASSRRTIHLSTSLVNRLTGLRAERGACRPDDLLFPARTHGGFMHYGTAHKALQRACEAADVPPITPHELRHNGGSIAFMNGVDIKTISERMGHANIATTLRVYTHLNQAHHQTAAGRIAAILGLERDSDMTFLGTHGQKPAQQRQISE
jgi:integrase